MTEPSAAFEDFRADILNLWYVAPDGVGALVWPPIEERRTHFRERRMQDNPLERAIADLWEQAHTDALFRVELGLKDAPYEVGELQPPIALHAPSIQCPACGCVIELAAMTNDLAELRRLSDAIQNPDPEPETRATAKVVSDFVGCPTAGTSWQYTNRTTTDGEPIVGL